MGHQRRRYREQEIAPKRIPEEAWYSLPAVTRERISRDYYDGHDELVTPGVTFIGSIQDSLRAAGRAAAAARFMRAMQEWFDAQEPPEAPLFTARSMSVEEQAVESDLARATREELRRGIGGTTD